MTFKRRKIKADMGNNACGGGSNACESTSKYAHLEECIEIGRQAYDFFCSLKEKDARVRDARLTEEEEGLVTFLLETGFLYES